MDDPNSVSVDELLQIIGALQVRLIKAEARAVRAEQLLAEARAQLESVSVPARHEAAPPPGARVVPEES